MPAVLRPALRSVTRRTLNRALARDRSISFCRLRTFARSPARDAVKMRWRRRRTWSSTSGQSTDPQSSTSSSGPFTTALPWRPTCPSVLVSSSIVYLTGPPDHVSTLSGRERARIRPVMRDDQRRGQSYVPFSCRLSACRHSLLGHPLPAGELGLPCGRLTGPCCHGPDPDRGCHVSHARVATGVGALLTPGTVVLTRPTSFLPGRHLPHHNGKVPIPRSCFHRPRATSNEASLRVHCIHPSGLPLACGPRMERAPLGLLPELRTPPLPATHVWVGTGIEHLPGATQSTYIGRPSFLRARSQRATSCRKSRNGSGARWRSPTRGRPHRSRD